MRWGLEADEFTQLVTPVVPFSPSSMPFTTASTLISSSLDMSKALDTWLKVTQERVASLVLCL